MNSAATFETIVRAHQGAVRAFLRRLTGNEALADELAQETFLKAYRSRAKLPDITAHRSWLFRIAYRTFLDQKRLSDRRDHLSQLDADALADHARPTHFSSDAAIDIARTMGELTPERRACAMLSLGMGHSHGEIAEITGLPLGTVKSHIVRAKAALQLRLKEYDYANPS